MSKFSIREIASSSLLLKILSYFSLSLFVISTHLRTKTLKPWSDEIVSLVSNLNFYYSNFNFIGPNGSQYFKSYIPGLTAGPISAIGGIVGWTFSENIYILRFSNLIYLIIISTGFSFFVFKTFNIDLKNNFLLLNTLLIFTLTNTSWWYSVLYLLPETICSVIFVNSVFLFSKKRRLSLFLMSFCVFFGDFLTVLMFAGFYFATIFYERSLTKIINDIFYAFFPVFLWSYLVVTFSEYNLDQYLIEYFEHYFKHPSGGEVNFSIKAIIDNFNNSEVSTWGVADILRVLVSPIIFIFVFYRSEKIHISNKLGKLQIIFPLLFIFGWFWLLSPAKSIIYSGLFTTYILILNSYILIFSRYTNKINLFASLLIFSFYLSSIYIVGIYIFLTFLIINIKDTIKSRAVFVSFLLVFLLLNQVNTIIEISNMPTYEIDLSSCKISLTSNECLDDYFGR